MVLLRTQVARLAEVLCFTPRFGIFAAVTLTVAFKHGQYCARSLGFTSREMAAILPDRRRKIMLMQDCLTWEEDLAKLRAEHKETAN